jgi:hypothetical protein
MTQGDRRILEALVWMIGDVDGLEHDHARMPDVPGPGDLRAIEELTDDSRSKRYSFFTNLDERPTSWIADWEHRRPDEPRVMTWFRFRPVATFADPAVEACWSLILMDTMEWPAAVRAHTGPMPWVAPSLDLSVRFHRLRPDSEWLFSDTSAAVASSGARLRCGRRSASCSPPAVSKCCVERCDHQLHSAGEHDLAVGTPYADVPFGVPARASGSDVRCARYGMPLIGSSGTRMAGCLPGVMPAGGELGETGTLDFSGVWRCSR